MLCIATENVDFVFWWSWKYSWDLLGLLWKESVFCYWYVLLILCLMAFQYCSLSLCWYVCCSDTSNSVQKSSFNLNLIKEPRKKQREREKRGQRQCICRTLTDLKSHTSPSTLKSHDWNTKYVYSYSLCARVCEPPEADTFSSPYFLLLRAIRQLR